MSTRYTVRLRCRVERRCPRCRAEYRTHLPREADADGETPEDAARVAARRALRELASTADPHPCPACGRLPTDTFNRRRAAAHGLATAGGLFLLFLAWAVGPSGLLAAVAVLATAAAHAWIVLRMTTVQPVRELGEDVELLTDGTPNRPWPMPSVRTHWHLLGVGGTLLATLVSLTPSIAARRSGEVLTARPGEPLRVEFAESITVTGEDWTGTPKVTVRNSRDYADRVPSVQAESHRATKTDDRSQTVRPWVELTLPEDPALAARPIELRIDLEVAYTGPDGRGPPTRRTMTASRDVTLAVAPTSLGGRLRSVSVGSVGLFFAGLMVLSAGLFLRTLDVPDPGEPAMVEVDEVAVAPADRDERPTGTGRFSRPEKEDEP